VDDLFACLVRDFVDESKPIAREVGSLALKLEGVWTAGGDAQPLLRGIRSGLHTIKGNAAMMGLTPIEQMAHALEDFCALLADRPAFENLPDAQRFPRLQSSQSLQSLIDGCDILDRAIESALAGEVDRVPVDAFVRQVKEASLASPASRNLPDAAQVRDPLAGRDAAPEISAPGDDSLPSGNARIADRDVDELLELAGETIIGQTELLRLHGRLARGQFEASDVALMDRILTDLGRTTRQMRHQLLRVRLAPIATLFRRYTRYVRDLSRARGQPIQLLIEGGETAVDRAIIRRLFEPLVHIVRNSIAHGIEPPAERMAAGKPTEAKILLSARMREGRVSVCIADDGRGLDIEAIVAKAKHLGLDTSQYSDGDLQRLIFRAGFSTAQSVTRLAGRGVGLDVVASVVQDLGGTIDVRSAAGQGTVFVLDLPVTVSLQKALIFGVDSEMFAVPTGFVLDAIEIRDRDLQAINRVLLVSWRGDFIRSVDAGRLLGCQGLARAWTRPYAIVLQAGNKRGVLLVDWLSGVQEIVVKPLDEMLVQCGMIAGLTLQGQGRVVPILDCVQVVRRISTAITPEKTLKEELGAMDHAF
jgi:two-component system chemotaxis sensor kinase CheA